MKVFLFVLISKSQIEKKLFKVNVLKKLSNLISVVVLRERINIIRIGNNISEEEVLQYVVPAGTWFASELENKNEFALCGCTVSPGFDFNDFEMPEKNQLLKLFPLHEEFINRLGYSKK